MAETLLLAAATSATTAAGTAAVSLPWLSTAGSLASIAGAGGAAGSIAGLAGGASLLSSGFTGFSAFGSILGGNQQAAASKAQAQQYELQARQEELRGREQADQIRRSLQASLASQNAIYSARGISTRTGTPVTLAGTSSTAAARDIEDAQFNASSAALGKRLQGVQSKIEGKAAKTTGYTNAATKLYGGADMFGSLLR